jgi:cysteine desulfurase
MKDIYLDYNATTPVDSRVAESMKPFISENFHNPSSLYKNAKSIKKSIEESRDKIAALIGASPKEIIFTGGGSESDNHAIKGVAFSLMNKMNKGKHIITSSIEHHAVLHTCKFLEKIGFEITYLPVDKYGFVSPEDVREAIREDTLLVSVMYANNEIGTIEPVNEISAITREKGVLFHTDAVQAVGKIPINVKDSGIDLLSLSAHKFYGPKGVGALYVRKMVRIENFIHGGMQERGKRAGTENISGIIGMGKAAEIALEEMEDEKIKIKPLRDKLELELLKRIPDIIVNGHPEQRLYNTLNIVIKYIEGEGILTFLDIEGISVSSGSACASGSLEPSHVLLSTGIPVEHAHGSLRFSLGKYNTSDDIDKVIEVLPEIVEKLRAMSPLWNKR